MPRCCDCLLTEAVIHHTWLFSEVALENHKFVVFGSLMVGSLAAAYYFFKEGNRMEEVLCSLTCCLRKVEEENHLLRVRAHTLRRQKAALQKTVGQLECCAKRANNATSCYKKRDCLARAELGSLNNDVRSLWARIEGAKWQRDIVKKRLRNMMSCRGDATHYTSCP